MIILLKQMRIEYKKLGSQGKNIIFFHGGTLRYNSYLPLLKEVAKSNVVHAINFPGHGKSVPVNDYGSAVAELTDFINNLNLQEVYLVGHSFGGSLADRVAVDIKNLKGILIVNPFFMNPNMGWFEFLLKYFVIKNIYTFYYHPRFLKFYFYGLFDFIYNLVYQNKNALKMLGWVLDDNYDPSVRIKNIKYQIIIGKNEIFLPSADWLENRKEYLYYVKGGHDWFMGDIKRSSEMIKELVG